MLLEGPDLKGILREIESNYGRDFKVIQAEQVRSGGLGGFFAKQHYEVTIEIVDPRLAAGLAARPVAPGTALSEIATRSQNDQAAASSQEWARVLLEQARALNSQDVGDNAGAGEDPLDADEFAELGASAVSSGTESSGKKIGFRLRLRNKRLEKNRAKRPSRTAPASEEQQSRLRDLLAQAPPIEESSINDHMSPADRLVAEMDAQDPSVHIAAPALVQQELPAAMPVTVTPAAPEAAKPVSALSSIGEEHWRTQISEEIRAQRNKVERFYSKRGTLGPDEARLLQIFNVAETIARSSSAVHKKSPAVLSESPRRNSFVPESVLPESVVEPAPLPQTMEPAAAPQAVQPSPAPQAVVSAPVPQPVQAAVRASGAPAAFAIMFQAPDLPEQELADWESDLGDCDLNAFDFSPAIRKLPLSRVPVGVPLDAGDVLVLVGDAQDAYQQASAINEACGNAEISILAITPTGVSVAGLAPAQHFLYSGADQVLDLVNRQQTPTIVIVHAPFPMGTNDLDRVRIVKAVEALKADHVWAVVDACRTAASLSRWTQCFGNISGLMVINELDARNPGAMKALGIPIVFRDGVPSEDAETKEQGSEPFSSADQVGNLAL